MPEASRFRLAIVFGSFRRTFAQAEVAEHDHEPESGRFGHLRYGLKERFAQAEVAEHDREPESGRFGHLRYDFKGTVRSGGSNRTRSRA